MDAAPEDSRRRAAAFITRPRPAFEKSARKPTPRAPAQAPGLLSVGDTAPDGSIYLGVYKGCDWFVTARDLRGQKNNAQDNSNRDSLALSFDAAAQKARRLRAHGRHDWRVPDLEVLKLMYQHRATGAFKGSYQPAAWYWSGTEIKIAEMSKYAWMHQFGEDRQGTSGWYGQQDGALVRCVRSLPRP